MSTATRLLTYADLLDTPDDGQRYEVIDGRLIVTPAPATVHQKLSLRLTLLIGNFVTQHRLGQVFVAPCDVMLSEHAIVQPDLIFVDQARLDIVGPKYVEGVPDLVVEILSPRTRRRDAGSKRDLYARFGVPEYWRADPDGRSLVAEVLREGRYEPLLRDDGIVRSSVLPGLEVDVSVLFAGL